MAENTVQKDVDAINGKSTVEYKERSDPEDVEHRIDNSRDLSELRGYYTSFRFIGSVIAITLMAHNLFIGFSMPANVLTIINQDLGPSTNYTLISLVYGLCNGVLMLIVGRLSDIVGRRYFILGAQLVSIVGSTVCAKAQDVNTVIAGTCLTGLAGGAQQLYALFLHELVPNKYRAHLQAVCTFALFPSMGFAPAIARAFVQHTSQGWRWCYWLNLIISVISFTLFLFCYFPPNFYMINSQLTKVQELKRLDYIGFILYTGGLTLLLLGFTWPQGTYAWKSAHVISALVVGTVSVTGFVLYEIYGSPRQPLMPMQLLKIRNYSAIILVGAVGQMVYYALAILWPIHVTVLYTSNNTLIGIMSCTTGIALVTGEVIVGHLFHLVGKPRWQLLAATIGLTTFCGAMAAANENREGLAIAATVIAGFMIGWIELIALVIAGLVVPANDIGAGQGFFGATRSICAAISASIYLTIYSSRLTTNLPKDIVPAVRGAGLPGSSVPALFAAITNGTAAAVANVPGMTAKVADALETATKHAYSSSFSVTYLSSIAFGAVAIISASFIQDVDTYLTTFVNKTIHKPEIRERSKVMPKKVEE